MGGRAWNVASWCNRTIPQNDSILVSTGPISDFGGQKNSDIGFPGILRRTHGRHGPKCGMLIYTDHLKKKTILASIGPDLAHWLPQILVKLGFLGILKRMHGRNGLKCGMVIYPGHLQKCFEFGQYWSNFTPLMAIKSWNWGFMAFKGRWKEWMV